MAKEKYKVHGKPCRSFKEAASMAVDMTCGVCLDRVKDTALDPCSHMACSTCAASLRTCHICRAPIDKLRRVFL